MADDQAALAPSVFSPTGQMQGNFTSDQGVPPRPAGSAPPGLEDVQAQAQADQAQERQALAGPMSQLRKAEGQRPQMPQLAMNKEPPPDFKNFQKNSMEFASAMAVLGAISSRFTRQPGGAALGAFASAVNGWQSGNLAQYEAATKEWQEKTKQTIVNNRTVLEQYKLALENNQHNIDEQMSAIALTAVKYHDDMMYQAATAKNFTMVAQLYEKGVKNTGQLEMSTERLTDTRKKETAQQALVGERLASGMIDPNGVNPKTGQPWSEAEKQYFKYTEEQYRAGAYNEGKKGAGGVSGVRMSARNSIIQDLTEQLGRKPTLDEITKAEAKRAGDIAAERIRATAEPKALSGALGQLEKTGALLDNFEEFARQQGDRLIKLADKVDRTGKPAIDRWVLAGRKATGDPDVAAFDAQISFYRGEVARILAGNPNLTGVVSDTARGEINSFLKDEATPQQIRAVVNVIGQDFNSRNSALQAEMAKVRGRLNPTAEPGAAPAQAGGAKPPAPGTVLRYDASGNLVTDANNR
jgi:hypothetical protein